MKEYWKMILKCVSIGMVIFVFCFRVVIPQYKMGYVAAFSDKYDLEHKKNKEPRIILMGDSNVAFGIDSERIEAEIGMPVVNMGLHGGLGQAFCMDMAKSGIRENDLVILMPSYYDYSERTLDGTIAWTLLENKVYLWKEVNIRDYGVLAEGLPAYLKKAITLWVNEEGNKENTESVYRKSNFNRYGDIIATGNDNIMNLGYIPGEEESYKIVNESLLNYYNKYNQYVLKAGASMVIAGAPIIDSPGQLSEDELGRTFEKAAEKLEFQMISDYRNYIYPMEYFFDTNHHLNDTGRKIRTEQLIQDIKKWMSHSDYRK